MSSPYDLGPKPARTEGMDGRTQGSGRGSSRIGDEKSLSGRIRDNHAQNEAWDEKEEANSEEFPSDETVVQMKSMR